MSVGAHTYISSRECILPVCDALVLRVLLLPVIGESNMAARESHSDAICAICAYPL